MKSLLEKYMKRILFVAIVMLILGNSNQIVKAEKTHGFFKYEITNDNTICITDYTGTEANVTIPSIIEGKKVEIIGGSRTIGITKGAFRKNNNLVSVTIPITVKEITDGAFSCCSNLTQVKGMGGVVNIGPESFAVCSKLKSISFGKKLESIGSDAFSVSGLENVEFPDSLKTIGSDAFSSCLLKSVKLPENLTELGVQAFCGCKMLQSIIFNEKLETIPENCLYGCPRLKNVTIPKGIKTIGKLAFGYDEALTDISLPESVRYIEKCAFGGCESLKNLTLKFGLLRIDDGAFGSCNSLVNVVIPNSVTTIGLRVFSGCNELKSITLPNSVTSFGDKFDWYVLTYNKVVVYCYANSYSYNRAIKENVSYKILKATPSKNIKFKDKIIYTYKRGEYKIGYIISPYNTTDAIVWKSSNTDVAEVNQLGEVKIRREGNVTITATTTSGKRATIDMVITEKPTYISFGASSKTILVGKKMDLKALIKDSSGFHYSVEVIYKSSNKKIATVNSSGVVKGIKPGTVTITAQIADLTARCTVKVVRKMAIPKIKKKGKILTIKTIKGAKVKVKASKKILGVSSKSVKANKKGIAKIKFKKKIKGKIKVIITKSGYSKKTVTKKY